MRLILEGKDYGEGIEQVLHLYLLIIHDSGKVYLPVPTNEFLVIGLELGHLLRTKVESQASGSRDNLFHGSIWTFPALYHPHLNEAKSHMGCNSNT